MVDRFDGLVVEIGGRRVVSGEDRDSLEVVREGDAADPGLRAG